MGWLGSDHPNPSQQMLDVLEGRLSHDDAPVAVQSICRKAYFDAAQAVLALDKGKRKNALQRIPETCRKNVESEIMRLWNARPRR